MEMTDFSQSFGFLAFDFSAVVDKIYFFGAIFLLAAILGGIILLIVFFWFRRRNTRGKKKIGWWEEVGDKLVPASMEDVEELVIPGTLLRVFYSRKNNKYLPRFSRGVSKDLYYVTITKTGQMVNFELKGISKDLREANLEYDHTDMLWAAENAREFIKRNYTDKSKKWWEMYQGAITAAIFIVVMTFSFIIIIFFMRGMVQDLQPVSAAFAEAAKTIAENKCVSSGIQTAG